MHNDKAQQGLEPFYGQCFGSRSRSLWIRIEMDPWIRIRNGDTDPRSGSRTVKMTCRKAKNQRFRVKKSIEDFAEGLMVIT